MVAFEPQFFSSSLGLYTRLQRSTWLISLKHDASSLFLLWLSPMHNRNIWDAIHTVALELPQFFSRGHLTSLLGLSNGQADLWRLSLCKSLGWHHCEDQSCVHHLINGMSFWVELFKTKMDEATEKIRPSSLRSNYIMVLEVMNRHGPAS